MRIVELFDGERPINNVMVQATYPQAQVVFVGLDGRPTDEERARLARYFREGGSPEPEFVDLGQGCQAAQLAGRLEPIVCGDDVYVETSGGADALLVALGVVAGRQPVNLFMTDATTAVPKTVAGKMPPITAARRLPSLERVVGLLGGRVVDWRSEDSKLAVDGDTRRAVDVVWREYRRDPAGYNHWAGVFARLVNSRDPGAPSEQEHDVCVDADRLSELGRRSPADLRRCRDYLGTLQGAGLVAVAQADQDGLAFDYRSRALRQIVDKPGLVLELFARICATDAGVFDEVRQGVVLDWDGDLASRGYGVGTGTSNEVDLVLTRGFKTLYVSCKSGEVDNKALYELQTVAEKFDTGNVKTMLVCGNCTDAIVERAGDMGIYLFANAHEDAHGESLKEMLTLV